MHSKPNQMFEVEVIYAVRRRVYVTAASPSIARKLAGESVDNWEDAGEVHEDMDTLRLPTHRVFEGTI
jgi:hypothetical protein